MDKQDFMHIKKKAIKGEFDVLLVFMFDRLGRREDETPFVVQWFVQQGIEVWSTREGSSASTPTWTSCSTTSGSGRHPAKAKKPPSVCAPSTCR